jgi:glycosyltransferase involved in cell wall biosynthesis
MILQEIPFVSVIIPTRNRREILKDSVVSIFDQLYPKNRYEIIIIDNNSTDGTAETIKSLQENTTCILKYYRKLDEGPGSARNYGISRAFGSIIAFTDSDCVADSYWIEKGVSKMTDGVGFVQGKTVPNLHQRVGDFSKTQNILGEDGLYQTCNMFYLKGVLDSVEGFSEDFIGLDPSGVPLVAGEDIDLAWKVKKHGWKSVFADDSIVYHHVFDGCPWMSIYNYRKYQLFFYTWPRLVKKHPEIRKDSFYLRLFRSRDCALFVFSLLSIGLGIFIHPVFFLLAFPYAISLLTWSFYERPLRTYYRGFIVLIVHFLNYFVNFILLLGGSVRYRSFVL